MPDPLRHVIRSNGDLLCYAKNNLEHYYSITNQLSTLPITMLCRQTCM